MSKRGKGGRRKHRRRWSSGVASPEVEPVVRQCAHCGFIEVFPGGMKLPPWHCDNCDVPDAA
jgi:hypothetical protein